MKGLITTLILGFFVFQFSKAQVGIGNPIPRSGSILDLRNTNNKALLLPSATSAPSGIASFDTSAMVMYYNNYVYLKTSSGVNVLSPWLFDGTAASGVSLPSGTAVGIGLTPISSSPVRLHIAQGASEIVLNGTNGSIAIGDVTAQHILIDNNEIMSKSATSSAGILELQEEAGTVEIRTGAAQTSTTVLTAKGSIDASKRGRIKENGFDLMPVGTVVMWFGTVNGNGFPLVGGSPDSTWHVCDGTTQPKKDGSGNVTTPDLRNQFIVGAGSTYALSATGGSTTSTHTHAIDPPNTTSTPVGNHTHTGTTGGPSGTLTRCWCASGDVGDGSHTHNFTTNGGGAHSHDTDISSFTSGGSSNTENRPPYYALYYIMKL